MKTLIYSILFFVFIISCDKKNQEIVKDVSMDEVVIPSIEKNKLDADFQLINGVLHFENKPYSGIVKEFYPNKKLKTTSEYYQGKRQGKFFGFYPNGNKWFKRFYANGIKIGTHKGWFQNKVPMFNYQLNNKGVYHGSVKDWHFNGQIAKHFNFVDGKESGSQKMWNPNGKIRANFYAVNGDRHGLIGLKNCVSILTSEN